MNNKKDYLNELKKRVIAVGIIFISILVIGLIFSEAILKFVISSVNPENVSIVLLSPYESISLFFQVILWFAIIVTLPFVIYHAIRFIGPSLDKKERRIFLIIPFAATILFFIGALFGYFSTKEIMMPFIISLGNDLGIVNMWSISSVLMFYIYICLFLGISFEMPLLAVALVKIKVLHPSFLSHYRKHSYIAMLVIDAIVTPTTDAFSMIVIAIPLIVLYEITIIVSKMASRKEDINSYMLKEVK